MKHSGIKTSWDSIPTQSQSDLARKNVAYHQALAFDEKQVHNGKRGRAGHFITAAEATVPDKVRFSDSDSANLAKARARAMRAGDRAATEWLGAYHIVYENPQDRVFRNGRWVTIKELNAPLKAAQAKRRRKKKRVNRVTRDNPVTGPSRGRMAVVIY